MTASTSFRPAALGVLRATLHLEPGAERNGYAIHTTVDSFVPVAHVFADAPDAEAYANLLALGPEMVDLLEEAREWVDSAEPYSMVAAHLLSKIDDMIGKARGR